MAGLTEVRVRRVYEPSDPHDGARVLVDGLWPRGLAKDKAGLDAWIKDVAPSKELRHWYGHDPDRFSVFAERYRTELRGEREQVALAKLRSLAGDGPLTLLTATRDLRLAHVSVLAEELGPVR